MNKIIVTFLRDCPTLSLAFGGVALGSGNVRMLAVAFLCLALGVGYELDEIRSRLVSRVTILDTPKDY